MASRSIEYKNAQGAALLSLDGGGIKGVSSIRILEAIMKKVAEKEKRDPETLRLPMNYFDLAGGTSTGGLAILMMFRLGMDTKQAAKQYHTMAAEVFSPRFLGMNLHSKGILSTPGYYFGNGYLQLLSYVYKSRFSAGPLEKAIDQVVQVNRCQGGF